MSTPLTVQGGRFVNWQEPTVPSELKVRTPCCGRACSLPFYQHASTVVKRTCRGCKGIWTIVVTPVTKASWGWAHKLEWTPREAEGPITL